MTGVMRSGQVCAVSVETKRADCAGQGRGSPMTNTGQLVTEAREKGRNNISKGITLNDRLADALTAVSAERDAEHYGETTVHEIERQS